MRSQLLSGTLPPVIPNYLPALLRERTILINYPQDNAHRAVRYGDAQRHPKAR